MKMQDIAPLIVQLSGISLPKMDGVVHKEFLETGGNAGLNNIGQQSVSAT